MGSSDARGVRLNAHVTAACRGFLFDAITCERPDGSALVSSFLVGAIVCERPQWQRARAAVIRRVPASALLGCPVVVVFGGRVARALFSAWPPLGLRKERWRARRRCEQWGRARIYAMSCRSRPSTLVIARPRDLPTVVVARSAMVARIGTHTTVESSAVLAICRGWPVRLTIPARIAQVSSSIAGRGDLTDGSRSPRHARGSRGYAIALDACAAMNSGLTRRHVMSLLHPHRVVVG
jgi:hypothetical protein